MWTVAQLSADLAAGRITSRDLVEQAAGAHRRPGGPKARARLPQAVHGHEAARLRPSSRTAMRRAGISPARRWTALPVSLKDLFDVAGT